MADDLFRLTLTVQLAGSASKPVFFDIKAVADDGKEYGASGAPGQDLAILKKALEAIGAAYPKNGHFGIGHDAQGRLLP